MKALQALKIAAITLLLGYTTVFACLGKGNLGCAHPQKSAVCAKKDCDLKMKGMVCDKNTSVLKMKGMMCHKGDRTTYKPLFLKNLRYTLKSLKISQSTWADVKLAFASYKDDLKKIEIVTPLESLQNGKFNRNIFLTKHPVQQKLAAQADLLETIFLLLDDDQKKHFAMLMGASQHYYRLHPNMCMTSEKNCH